mgnify:CR=1 FL=1
MTPSSRFLFALPLLAPLLGLAGCGVGGPAYGPPGDAAAVVEMTSSLAFQPQSLHIRAGETVEWRNKSPFTHSVTDDPALAARPGDASLPAGAEPFRASVPAGGLYRHSFPVAGSYHYFCEPHEGFGMVGEIVVE